MVTSKSQKQPIQSNNSNNTDNLPSSSLFTTVATTTNKDSTNTLGDDVGEIDFETRMLQSILQVSMFFLNVPTTTITKNVIALFFYLIET